MKAQIIRPDKKSRVKYLLETLVKKLSSVIAMSQSRIREGRNGKLLLKIF